MNNRKYLVEVYDNRVFVYKIDNFDIQDENIIHARISGRINKDRCKTSKYYGIPPITEEELIELFETYEYKDR